MTDQAGTPYQQPTSAANDWLAQLFLVNQILRGKAVAALVQVIACTNAGTLEAAGTVDVRILVNQVDGQGGSPTPHGPLYSLPYNRLQGGTFAAIVDPVKGDIGLAVFCHRDSSAVVKAHGPASPGSDDVMGYSSGMYFGGFLNGAPTSYVMYTPGAGIKVVDPLAVAVQAPTVTVQATNVTVDASAQATVQAPAIALTGDTTVTGTLTVTGAAALEGGLAVTGGTGATVTGTVAVTGSVTATVDVTADGTSVHNHEHGPGTYVAGSTAVTGDSGTPL